jgi:hypothetical protein
MNKSSLAIVLFVGVFLLYTGIMGSKGFTGFGSGLQLTTGFTDAFSGTSLDTSKWTTHLDAGVTATVGGGLLTISTAAGYAPYTGGFVETVSDYVLSSADITVDLSAQTAQSTYGIAVTNQPLTSAHDVTPSGYLFAIAYETGQSWNPLALVERYPNAVMITSQNNFQYPVGTMKISIHSGVVTFSINGQQVYSEAWTLPTYGYISLLSSDPVNLLSSISFDNFNLALTGGPGPSPSPSSNPTQGTVTVYASYNGAYVPATLTLTGPTAESGACSNPSTWQVNSGSYSITAIYNGLNPQSVTVNGITESSWSVSAGTSYQVIINFGGQSPPPPGGGFDIKTILDNPTFRTFSVIIGVFMTGISGIALAFSGGGKKTITGILVPSPS